MNQHPNDDRRGEHRGHTPTRESADRHELRSIPLPLDEQRHLEGPPPKIVLADRPDRRGPSEEDGQEPGDAPQLANGLTPLGGVEQEPGAQLPAPPAALPSELGHEAVPGSDAAPPTLDLTAADPTTGVPSIDGTSLPDDDGFPAVEASALGSDAPAISDGSALPVDEEDQWVEVDAAPAGDASASGMEDADDPVGLLGEDAESNPAVFVAGGALSPRHQLEAWLGAMIETQASDLILRAGGRPSIRVNGKIEFLPGRVPNSGPMLEVLDGVVGVDRMETWRDTGSVDIALDFDGIGRFRLNAYRQMGNPALVLRRIANKVPSLDSLNLPSAALKKLVKRTRGMMLVTGIAGSGKSTTLAAMIQQLNRDEERHIITLEDPVETVFTEEKCVISQREVGTDCPTFHQGLRHSLRQSPDLILIGEMRDAETVAAALDATETGHMVMSTLHTVNAPQTLDRILGFFPSEQHVQISTRLGENLAAVLSLRLLPTSSGDGMVPACELMTTTPHVRELLAECKTAEISRVIEQGNEPGQISFNQSLRRLVERGLIDLEVALSASDRPDELLMALRGITGGDSHRRKMGGDGRLKMAE